ncbi:MAG: exodeoxyribonuclease V subunit beta [bacterium]
MEHFDLLNSPLDGRNLIEASAGTGKTYTIASLYIRLLLEKRLSVDEILVVTFTIAATEELRGRIRNKIRELQDAYTKGRIDDEFLTGMIKKVPDARSSLILLANALSCFDEAAIFTIHGFCQRILQDKAFECSSYFTTDLITNQKDLLQEVTDDFWRIHIYPASPHFISFIQSKKKDGWNPQDLALFAAKNINKPNLKIIPEGDLSDTEELEAHCLKIHGQMCELWQHARAEIENILVTSTALKRNIYKVASIPSLLRGMDSYCNRNELNTLNDRVNLFPFGHIKKFASQSLSSAVKKGYDPPQHSFFDVCDRLILALEDLNAAFEQRLLALRKEFISFVCEELSRRKHKQNIRSFDDLLADLQIALQKEGGINLAETLRTKYKAALIDEFQDTDPVQYAIFKTIYPNNMNTLFLIGDPKQAIYSFRGADIFAYLEAAKDVDYTYTLGTNWRSAPELIEAVNTIFSNHYRPFLFDDIPFNPVKPSRKEKKDVLTIYGKPDRSPLKVWFMRRNEAEKSINKGYAQDEIALAVATEIGRLLQDPPFINERPVEPADIAVLVRSNAQARTMQEVLRKYGIPSILYSSESLFASAEARQLLTLLSAIGETSNDSKIKAAMATDILGISGDELALLIDDELKWEEWLDKFREYNKLWSQKGFMSMARRLMDQERVRGTLLAFQDGERRLTNVLHCLEVLHQAGLENKFGIEGLMKWFAGKIEEKPDKEEYQIRLETDEKAVKLITIHKSKGLEYSIVFCPFCWGRSNIRENETIYFHDPENKGYPTIDLGSKTKDLAKSLAEREILAENLRLFYVALTRAKYRCYMVWGMFKDAETSAPAYIFHSSQGGSSGIENAATIMKSMDDEEIYADLETCAKKSRDTIELMPFQHGFAASYFSPDVSVSTPSSRIFSGSIPNDWHVASFSSLTSGTHHDFGISGWDNDDTAQDEALTFLNFPRGAKAGTCLHEILQKLDYREKDPEMIKELIRETVTSYGYEDIWIEPVYSMLRDLLAIPLMDGCKDFALESICHKERINEMEFYFPLSLIHAKDLANLFSDKDLSDLIAKLDFTPLRGLVKGYIDLLFRYKGRYYIIDWKSNYLGNTSKDYDVSSMSAAMEKEYYHLQLHLYVVAVHKHLSRRIPDYAYDTHFGSVFYIFLRGIDAAHGSHYGIYQTRPSEALINDLCAYLSGTA